MQLHFEKHASFKSLYVCLHVSTPHAFEEWGVTHVLQIYEIQRNYFCRRRHSTAHSDCRFGRRQGRQAYVKAVAQVKGGN